jgi:hypothetical protein
MRKAAFFVCGVQMSPFTVWTSPIRLNEPAIHREQLRDTTSISLKTCRKKLFVVPRMGQKVGKR